MSWRLAGFADLAVGAPGEGISGQQDAGRVNVIYGSASGLNTHRVLTLDQGSASLTGVIEANDYLGGGDPTQPW